ncbi:amino acid transporter [Rhodococcus sp. WWJCD1]|uniref:APC family permease n=1 Tax=Rhodococcus sp. WWJCD1 TaxID=2022519 RepID=UPI000B9B5A64|nr:APC family permease [Rhodococcus sp. WWJCD1]OZC47240.1 amino acid transporter [Rhodococcus sp. WWJCD1]
MNEHKVVDVESKGLSAGQLGLLASVVLGISTIAPAYALTASLGPTVTEVGVHLPAIFIVGFIPMLLVALGYRELNAAEPDSGTSFTWASKAFGPYVGWMGGWGLIAATIIVLSNLAGVAVDFFYLFLAQVTSNDSVADLTGNKLVNIVTCLVFMALSAWLCYRGMQETKRVQYTMLGFQLLVMAWFIVAAFVKVGAGDGADDISFSLDWFDPFGIPSFSAFTAGLSLSIFMYWGWDVCLTVNEETSGSAKIPGRAALVTVFFIIVLYLLTAVATLLFAGTGDTGNGLQNPDTTDNVFAALAGPVMGPFAVLLSLAVLSSSASSLQATFISPARTLLAMGHYQALPKRFASITPRFSTPGFATLVAGGASAGFYAVMRVVSDNVLTDTIAALGLMICFYYGITAFACVWYFREELFTSTRNVFFKFLAPLLGGVGMAVVFVQTSVDAWDPEFGSGSSLFGIGMVFLIGVGIIVLGIVIMLVVALRKPDFFKGDILRRDTPSLIVED